MSEAPLPPGRFGLPLLGETLALLANPYAFLEARRAAHGPVFKSSVLGRKVVFVSGAAAMTDFLEPGNVTRERAHPGHVRTLFGGVNMNMFDGPRHFALKSLALEAFDAPAIATYLPDLERLVEATLESAATQPEVRAVDVCKRLAVEAIAQNIFGEGPGERTAALLSDYLRVMAGMTSPPIPLPGTTYSRAKAARDRCLAYLRAMVADHRATPRADGVSRMLAARRPDGQQMTDEEAVFELHHVVIAGYIVYALLTASLRALARDPALLEAARAEVQARLPSGPCGLRALAEAPLLNRLVQEAKRTAPIVPFVFGKAARDFVTGGVRIPQGWDVYFALSLSNSDAGAFHEPARFDPDRFGPGREEHTRHPHAFVPQGGGPPTGHRCLGLEYSTFVALVFLVHVLRGYRWEHLEPDAAWNWKPTPPEPTDGLRTKFHRLP